VKQVDGHASDDSYLQEAYQVWEKGKATGLRGIENE